ncbi:hypothetical protein N658DRAFT_94617 [Parathielavia hyrcaniae]|uniref:Uncharacterized protein n=1 Tax=Parathielavia hyrcaniae TaxID=113614 RepID=A0AAN6T1F6_9PEZI|nr:hypothetical protein N658DRAFT_94617 [Parathielavia hyrcaniae]
MGEREALAIAGNANLAARLAQWRHPRKWTRIEKPCVRRCQSATHCQFQHLAKFLNGERNVRPKILHLCFPRWTVAGPASIVCAAVSASGVLVTYSTDNFQPHGVEIGASQLQEPN